MPPKKPKDSPRRRQYLPAEQRRKLILEAAREVFARSGLKGARTRELAQAAGINQATLFDHFKSKEDLFMAAVIEPLATLLEGATERSEAYRNAPSAEILAEQLQRGMQDRLSNTIEMFPLLCQALFSDQAVGTRLYAEKIEPLLEAQASIMQGLLDDSVDPGFLQLASFGIFFAIAMDQAMTGKQVDLAQTSQQITGLLLHGCSPRR